MIKRITDKRYILDVLELVKNITIWDFDIQEIALFLELQIESPTVLVLMDTDKKAVSISSLYRDLITPYVCIMFAYTDPHYPELSKEMLTEIEKWALSYGVGTIKISIKKGIKAFQKKYGFQQEGILMKKELLQEVQDGENINTEG